MPIIDFEGVPGPMFQALEEAGHGSRIVIADRSLDFDRHKQTVVEYRGPTSDLALRDCLRLVRREDVVTVMAPDPSDTSVLADKALRSFHHMANSLELDPAVEFEDGSMQFVPRLAEDTEDGKGFYDVIRDSGLAERHIIIRTPDPRPYACATFIVGHSQFGE